MRIYDCVIIDKRADLDLLEARMVELAGFPEVVHVICEAEADYNGNPKPLWFWDQRTGRFGGFHGRWNHVRVYPFELPARSSPKVRKDALREYLAHGMTAEPHDLVMHGGVDEVPAEWAVRELLTGETEIPVTLEMRWCVFTPERVHPLPWRGTAIRKWCDVGSFAGLREKRREFPALLSAGTRLSMLGQAGEAHPDGHALWAAEVDESYPRWVRERQQG